MSTTPDETQPSQRPQTTSDLLKIKRALDGDSMWGLRMEIGFKLAGRPDTVENRIAVTTACVNNIYCDIDGMVSTETVTDAQMMDAIKALEG